MKNNGNGLLFLCLVLVFVGLAGFVVGFSVLPVAAVILTLYVLGLAYKYGKRLVDYICYKDIIFVSDKLSTNILTKIHKVNSFKVKLDAKLKKLNSIEDRMWVRRQKIIDKYGMTKEGYYKQYASINIALKGIKFVKKNLREDMVSLKTYTNWLESLKPEEMTDEHGTLAENLLAEIESYKEIKKRIQSMIDKIYLSVREEKMLVDHIYADINMEDAELSSELIPNVSVEKAISLCGEDLIANIKDEIEYLIDHMEAMDDSDEYVFKYNSLKDDVDGLLKLIVSKDSKYASDVDFINTSLNNIGHYVEAITSKNEDETKKRKESELIVLESCVVTPQCYEDLGISQIIRHVLYGKKFEDKSNLFKIMLINQKKIAEGSTGFSDKELVAINAIKGRELRDTLSDIFLENDIYSEILRIFINDCDSDNVEDREVCVTDEEREVILNIRRNFSFYPNLKADKRALPFVAAYSSFYISDIDIKKKKGSKDIYLVDLGISLSDEIYVKCHECLKFKFKLEAKDS